MGVEDGIAFRQREDKDYARGGPPTIQISPDSLRLATAGASKADDREKS
jgi:hypothetical protein